MDEISLAGLKLQSTVGIYPHEQEVPQPLEVDLRLYLDTRPAGTTGRIADTVDYAEIGGEVCFLLESSRFYLIETACEAIASYLLAPPVPGQGRPRLDAVEVAIIKSARVVHGASPRVRVRRERGEYELGVEEREFGRVDVVFESRECGIYRLRLKPGGTIPTHVHEVMDESELILTDGISLQSQPALRGKAHRWPKGFPHRYDNPTRDEQTVLCVDCPSFIPSDEIVVDLPPADLAGAPTSDYYDAGRHS